LFDVVFGSHPPYPAKERDMEGEKVFVCVYTVIYEFHTQLRPQSRSLKNGVYSVKGRDKLVFLASSPCLFPAVAEQAHMPQKNGIR